MRNKSSFEIENIIGKPKLNDVPLNYKTSSGILGDAFFEKDGFTLEITYNITNNRVNDFFICKDKPVSDYKMLEAAGNVLSSNDFILYPLQSKRDSSLYAGVTVTPK